MDSHAVRLPRACRIAKSLRQWPQICRLLVASRTFNREPLTQRCRADFRLPSRVPSGTRLGFCRGAENRWEYKAMMKSYSVFEEESTPFLLTRTVSCDQVTYDLLATSWVAVSGYEQTCESSSPFDLYRLPRTGLMKQRDEIAHRGLTVRVIASDNSE